MGLRGLIWGLRGLIWGLRGAGGGDGWMDGQMYGHLEIHPCVLQDIGPLGPLPKKGTDQLTNQPVDGRMNKTEYRVM